MENIKIIIDWCDKNFSAVTEDDRLCGMVIATGRTYEELISNLREAISSHVEGLLEDGEHLPKWLMDGDYAFVETLSTAALIRKAEKYTTLIAISRVTGINPTLLNHYATGLKKPREKQHIRILEGIRHIGEYLSIIG